ncbi:hypothetical protein [Clostridium sp.]|uniref:hypothetical protein n=1 Tax=Clostridium sp. TaxID=1506 RepID=UPI0028418872|nr:hypothetical protein [Clostridium sp.]MDR3595140.1 hypothetical protein [Clostridium sp.]
MGKLADYAATKDKLDKAIADEASRLYLGGLDYKSALRQAKEMFINKKETTKETDQSIPR